MSQEASSQFFLNLYGEDPPSSPSPYCINQIPPEEAEINEDYYEFIPYGIHINSQAMKEKLDQINKEWNDSHPEDLLKFERTTKVRFNSDHQLIILSECETEEDDADGYDEIKITKHSSFDPDFVIYESEDDESNNLTKTAMDWIHQSNPTNEKKFQLEAGDHVKIVPTRVLPFVLQELEANAEIKNKGQLDDELSPKFNKVVKDDKKYDISQIPSSAALEIQRLLEELRSPISEENSITMEKALLSPLSSEQSSSLATTKPKSTTITTGEEYSVSVIRAVFNKKSIGVLRTLQNPEMIPLVRAQIRKRNLPIEMLKEIFSENFIKLIFNNDAAASPRKVASEEVANVAYESGGDNLALEQIIKHFSNFGSMNSSLEFSEDDSREKVERSEKRALKKGRHLMTIPTFPEDIQSSANIIEVSPVESLVKITKTSDLTKGDSINIRRHFGGGLVLRSTSKDSGTRVTSSYVNHGKRALSSHSRLNSTHSNIELRTPSLSLKTKEKSTKAKGKEESRVEKQLLEAGRSTPIIDSDWLERKIRKNSLDVSCLKQENILTTAIVSSSNPSTLFSGESKIKNQSKLSSMDKLLLPKKQSEHKKKIPPTTIGGGPILKTNSAKTRR